MIELKDVTYRYPESDQPAIDGVSLEIERGSFLLVTGESGGGKSTLLRTLNGLVPHFHGGSFSGEVIVGNVNTTDTKPRQLSDQVGFVGQDPESQAISEKVDDDIAFALENLGTPPSTMRKRIEEVLDALGIARLRDRRMETLSGGERQRVAIAGALASMPAHLVLDEPTSQLDPQSAEEVLSALIRLRDEIGISVVLAEHRLERVVSYVDRIAVMTQGSVEYGTSADVLVRGDLGPPVSDLGRRLGWAPVPLTLRDARNIAEREGLLKPNGLEPPEVTVPGDRVAFLEGIKVTLSDHQALAGVDLQIGQGEIVVLMGRNGSGKTTLLRAMAGLITPKRGKVLTSDGVALVPQAPERILFRETVADEIAATLKGRGLPSRSSDVEKEAEWFRISHLLERHPRELSGGQKTKVSIAAATAGHPQLVLLDEPTRGMDVESKTYLVEMLKTWAAEGRAVLLATHDVELAARVATRVVLLGEGEVILDAPPHEALAESLTFSTQMNKVFGDPAVLTVDDAMRKIGR
jgi:energy-coupling factor transport system ATP-binding protein